VGGISGSAVSGDPNALAAGSFDSVSLVSSPAETGPML
jgi:hypothetical protein